MLAAQCRSESERNLRTVRLMAKSLVTRIRAVHKGRHGSRSMEALLRQESVRIFAAQGACNPLSWGFILGCLTTSCGEQYQGECLETSISSGRFIMILFWHFGKCQQQVCETLLDALGCDSQLHFKFRMKGVCSYGFDSYSMLEVSSVVCMAGFLSGRCSSTS